jgi:hypothetical protein
MSRKVMEQERRGDAMKLIKTVVMLLGLAGFAVTGQAAITLPFTDGFEDGTNNVNYTGDGWTYSGISAKATSEKKKTGSLGLYSPDSASLAVAAENIWFKTWTIVNPVDLTGGENSVTNIGTDAAAFFMDTTGKVHAYSNNTYVVVKTGLSTNAWHRFAAQLDYAEAKWNLYYKGPAATASAPYERLNASPLAFRSGFDALTSGAIEISGETYLDDVEVDVSILAADDMMENITTASLILGDAGTGLSLQYFGTNLVLSSTQGALLEPLFNVGDRLYFWNGTTFDIVEREAGGWTANTVTITPTTGFFITRAAGPALPTETLVTYEQTYNHRDTVEATPIALGWNLLTIPFTAGSRTLSGSLLPAYKDNMVFIWTSSGWAISRHDGSNWVPNRTIPAGRTFWFRRLGGSDSWPANTL